MANIIVIDEQDLEEVPGDDNNFLVCTYNPNNIRGGVSVHRQDQQLLSEAMPLPDTLIDLWLLRLWANGELGPRTHVLSAVLYGGLAPALPNASTNQRFRSLSSRLRSLVDSEDIDYVIIPMVVPNTNHWAIAVLQKTPLQRLLFASSILQQEPTVRAVHDCLCQAFELAEATVPLSIVQVPSQVTANDCGLYMLKNAHELMSALLQQPGNALPVFNYNHDDVVQIRDMMMAFIQDLSNPPNEDLP